MKPKHAKKREPNGTHSKGRRCIHWVKQNMRNSTNNQLKMAGKPMIRNRQMYIARRRYRMARVRRFTNCREDY